MTETEAISDGSHPSSDIKERGFRMVSKLFSGIQLKKGSCIIAALSSMFLAFGMYHVHSFAGVTEGGVLGFTLLL